MSQEPHIVSLVTIVWRDESKEPLKAKVESTFPEGSFLYVELLPCDRIASVKHKYLYFPMDTIQSVEVEEVEESDLPRGYREESTFRETPDKSPWFGGMGHGRQESSGRGVRQQKGKSSGDPDDAGPHRVQ